ncbi:hypothetical protein Celaphus_00006926, partial [Cervus elaphus hippelaphus]
NDGPLPTLAWRGGGHLAKHTNKVGIVGKHGARYGASLRKMVKKMKLPACQAHLLLLRQNQDEEMSRGHLALRFLRQNSRWWCRDLHHLLCLPVKAAY